MPGYHPVSIYNITMGTKRQAGAWGTLSLVGCPVRLVLGDSMLDSSAVFFKKKKKKKKKPPLLFFDKRKAFLSFFGAEEEMSADWKSFGCNLVLERLQALSIR